MAKPRKPAPELEDTDSYLGVRYPDRRDPRCRWTMGERRCAMLAAIYPLTGEDPKPGCQGICTWHYDVQRDPRAYDRFEEFEAWIVRSINAQYCDTWAHYPVAYLWARVHGYLDDPPPIDPTPCARGVGCAVSDGVMARRLAKGGQP